MIVVCKGTFIFIQIKANELLDGHTTIQLPDGYSYERLYVNSLNNININPQLVKEFTSITFPPVNCKSPSTISVVVLNNQQKAEMKLTIEKFGQIPDPHYFDNPFKPILVTGDDGYQYKVIPSDQFK